MRLARFGLNAGQTVATTDTANSPKLLELPIGKLVAVAADAVHFHVVNNNAFSLTVYSPEVRTQYHSHSNDYHIAVPTLQDGDVTVSQF